MSKLLKLKRWLSLEDAAKHLTVVLEEEVEVKDVLGLALDGHLKLSVYVVNPTPAERGKIVPIEKAQKAPPVTIFGEEYLIKGMLLGIKLNEREVLELNGDPEAIDGLWDLPMIGNERLDVEHERLDLISGPEVNFWESGRTFVESPNGDLYQLKVLPENENEDEDASLQEAWCLPDDAFLVVKTEALLDFLASLSTEQPPQKQPKTRENERPYKLIAQLIKMVLPDADLNRGDQTHGALTGKLVGDEKLAVSPKTLKTYLNKI